MSYDGLYTGVIARDLAATMTGAKIEKIQQPEPEAILLQMHTSAGRRKLLINASPQGCRVQYTELAFENPELAPSFCMLLRKHIQSGRVSEIRQIETERIIEFDIQTVNEMGYTVNKRLVAETMGKYSNVILLDAESGKIIDALKRLSIDVNRYRQILPGLIYQRPPAQDKISFWDAPADTPAGKIQGLCKNAAAELDPDTGSATLEALRSRILAGDLECSVYADAKGVPQEVHVFPLRQLESSCEVISFPDPHSALDYYFSHRFESNRTLQKQAGLVRSINSVLDKQLLKKQRLLDDLKNAARADEFRLKGELLNANLHLAKPGAKSVTVESYYDGSEVVIELDERFSAARNAQNYYKRYAKLKTAAKEKLVQLKETEDDIEYLRSMSAMASCASSGEELDLIRAELAKEGFVRLRTASARKKQTKPRPRRFTTSSGLEMAVGRNNTENDHITFGLGQKTDLWFHTKDIHGSHLVLFTQGREASAEDIYEAAAVAAWFSDGRSSENVPVDYVPLRYVKKPAGAKPGMVIFTNNRTVWVDPKEPE